MLDVTQQFNSTLKFGTETMPSYTLVVEASPDFDDAPERYESDVVDIMNSLENLISDIAEISRKNNEILFRSSFTKSEIKEKMRPVFLHHLNNVRCNSLN